jgi:flagellar biosynthesis/type III secretory pathway chaperone
MMQTSPQPNTSATVPAGAAATAAPSPTPAKDLVNKLLGIMTELTEVMEEEMPIIQSRNFSKIDHFIRRKQELTLDYQSMMKVFTENKPLITSLGQEYMTQLRDSGKKLDEVTQKNATALKYAHNATEHLLKVVINEIRKDLHKESGYSGRGLLALAESHQARPISVNQRV